MKKVTSMDDTPRNTELLTRRSTGYHIEIVLNGRWMMKGRTVDIDDLEPQTSAPIEWWVLDSVKPELDGWTEFDRRKGLPEGMFSAKTRIGKVFDNCISSNGYALPLESSMRIPEVDIIAYKKQIRH